MVVHLAGLSHVPTCAKDPELAFRINRDGTRFVAGELQKVAGDLYGGGVFVFASTAQVYQAAKGEEAKTEALFTEDRRIEPQNLYAETKWQAEEALRGIAKAGRLELRILRFFNHTHKTQSPDFFLPHIYSQLKAGKTEIPVGNLDIRRDFGALKDLLAALEIAVARELPGEVYNVCSGKAKSLRALAEGLAKRMGVQARFVTDPARVREGEPVSLAGSHELFTRATGWKPRFADESAFLDAFLSD